MADTSLDSVVVAGSSAASMGFAEEISYGKTPPAPVLKRQRIVSTTLSASTEMYSSNEPSRDRQGSAPRHGVRRAAGDIAVELSPGSHAAEYEAILGGYWQTPTAVDITGVPLTATLVNGILEITASSFSFIAADMLVGAPVTFTGADAALNGKKFIVTGHDANKVKLLPPVGFTLSGSPVSLSTGTFHIKGARVGMGTIFRSFVNERAFEDIGKFWVFNGIVYNTFGAELPPTGIATGTFGVLGQAAGTLTSASIDGVSQVSKTSVDLGTVTFNRAAGTITRSTGSWITDTVVIGDKVQFSGTGITEVQNRNVRTVVGVTSTVLRVEEAIADGTYASEVFFLKVGSPDYLAPSEEDVLVAVSGAVLVNGERVAVVTGLSFNIDNQMSGDPVVGTNNIPFYAFGTKCMVTVNPTVYFTRGGAGETMLNAALAEEDVTLVLSLDSKDGDDGLSFVFPRVLFAPGQFSNDASISVSLEGEAAKPLSEDPELGSSKIYIYDTTVTTGIEPPVAALVLTGADSGVGGVANFTVSGGTAPYSFDADDGGTTSDAAVSVAGAFTYTYATDGTYDPIIIDGAGRTATTAVTITSAA